MDDESGESMEPMEEMPLVGLGEWELDGMRGWRREAGSWFLYDAYCVNDRTFKCVHTYIYRVGQKVSCCIVIDISEAKQ